MSTAFAVLACIAAAGCAEPAPVNYPALPVTAAATTAASTEETTEATETTEPPEVEYAERSWTGGVAELPVGWSEVVRAEGWWDLHDPEERRILRIRTDAVGGPPVTEAEAELTRLAAAAGFEEVSHHELAGSGPDGMWATGAEIRYRYDREGTPREATIRFLGDAEYTIAVIGLITGPDEHDTWLPALDRLQSTFRPAG